VSEAAVTVELPARVVADPNASGLIQSVHGGRINRGRADCLWQVRP